MVEIPRWTCFWLGFAANALFMCPLFAAFALSVRVRDQERQTAPGKEEESLDRAQR